MRPVEAAKRYLIRRAEARARPASARQLLDFAIGVTALGAAGMIAAALLLRAPALGLELGSRLVFALCLLLAARPWLAGQGGPR